MENTQNCNQNCIFHSFFFKWKILIDKIFGWVNCRLSINRSFSGFGVGVDNLDWGSTLPIFNILIKIKKE